MPSASNAASEDFEDLYEAGIVDPTKVLRRALESATSVASTLLTAEAAIASIAGVEKAYLDPPSPDPKDMKPRVR